VDVKLVLPESEDLVVDMYAALGRPDDDPHWATLWQGSVALAEEVLENPSLVRGKRVLDLGTGLGLAGLAAGLAGAKEVVLTDREPRALYCALCAAAANGLVVPTQSGGLDDPVFGKDAPGLDGVPLPEVLSFKRTAGEDNTRDDVCVVSAALLDWFKPDCDQFGENGFDVVLACDVLYTPSAVDVIAPLVLRLFGKEKQQNKSTNNVFVLADPPGRFPENHERFLSLMEDPDRFADDESDEEKLKNRPALRARLMDGTGKSRECVNLEGEAMTVDLSTYVIEG
jgi:predicted nicotinamide N-methyase